jgi:hypothetical protein
MVVATLAACGGDGDDTAPSPPTKSTIATQGTTVSPPSSSSGDGQRDSGGGGQQGSRAESPRTTVAAVLTSRDPAEACGPLVTQRYLQAAYGGRQGCVNAQAPGSAAAKLDFKELRIDGDRATAVVVPSGGPYDGERLTVSLVDQGRRWSVDELEAEVPVGP